jgi:hypothetical protein
VTVLSETIAALRELRADLVSLRPMWLTHLKAIDEAVEALEEARKVIGPFAAGAENWDDPMYSADMTESGKDIPWPDDTPLYEPTVEYITVGDLRAARAFLAKHGASSDD